MAQRTIAAFKSTKNSRYADNTSGAVTAANSRDMFEDVADSALFIEDNAYSSFVVTASGTDTYTATLSPAITAYASTQKYFVLFTNANTGAATLNFNSLGAKSIVKNGATSLAAGDIAAGQIYCLAYDGTNLQIIGRIAAASISGSISVGQVAYASGSDAIKGEAVFTYNETTDELSVRRVKTLSTATYAAFAETGVTADPSTLTDGDKWYRTDTDEFMGRANGASVSFHTSGGPAVLKSYTVAGVPAASSYTGAMIYVSNETGGAIPAFSDGTNWRRVTDRAIIS